MGELYQTGREMTRPLNSGVKLGALTPQERAALVATLTEEERRAPSAKYYDEPMAELTAAHRAALDGAPLAPEDCPMPRAAGDLLLDPRSGAADNGYGVLENGVGYAAITIEQEGITDEMIAKYREEFAHDGPPTLFYKIWFPGAHLIHYEDGVVEDFGWGMLELEMDWGPFTLGHLGLTQQEIPRRDQDCICLLGLCGRGWPLEDPSAEPVYTCMVQHTRQTERGRELRVRYWSGILFRPDGTLEYHVDPDRARTEAHMRLMMEHCMREYRNELRLIHACWQAS